MRPRPFIPPYLLRHLSEVAAARPEARQVAERCRAALELDARLRTARAHPPQPRRRVHRTPGELSWLVHSAGGTTALPGEPARDHTRAATGDAAVDEAWEGVRATLAMFADVHARTSYDDAGIPVLATVHFGRDYANAFWDGSHLAAVAIGGAAAAGRHAAAVRDAWQQVGVGTGAPGEPAAEPAERGHPRGTVEVRRTGGFAGLATVGALDLGSDDPRCAEGRRLLEAVDFAAAPGPAYADEYVFVLRCDSREVAVPEHELTPALRRLVELLLS